MHVTYNFKIVKVNTKVGTRRERERNSLRRLGKRDSSSPGGEGGIGCNSFASRRERESAFVYVLPFVSRDNRMKIDRGEN